MKIIIEDFDMNVKKKSDEIEQNIILQNRYFDERAFNIEFNAVKC